MTEAVWRIEMLGGLRAVSFHDETVVVSRFRTQKTAALLGYLALHRDRALPRDVVQNALWPNDGLEAGRNLLRVALNSLRKQLEPPGTPHSGVLFADRTTIQLNPAACQTDVSRFEHALATAAASSADQKAAALTEALTLYAGELLPGVYEDWALRERDRLQERFLQTLLQSARQWLQLGSDEKAVAPARRATQTDPFSEEAARLLMQALARLGNPEAARQEFRRLAQALQGELGTTPSPATRTLAAQLEQIAEAAAKQPEKQTDYFDEPIPAAPALPPISEPTVSAQVSSLPFAFTRFFGRETEKAALCKLLHPANPNAPRLVTLLGAGGSGKTRLAIETARSLAPAYHDAVTFATLAEENTTRGIFAAIAHALHLPRAATGEYKAAVLAALSEKQNALLVLDNLEQAVSEGGSVVMSLLQDVPGLRILATSRRRLELLGERDFPVAPLETPARNSDTAPDARVWELPAVQLFVDRARGAQSDFAVTARNAADIAAVVDALEGIPLALELAAARIRTVSIGQMRAQLSPPNEEEAHRLPLLTRRKAADSADRHYSLRTAIAWSYEQLPPPLRRFFVQLSVFRGGWTTGAAFVICDEPFAGEYLTQLRAHSLVVLDTEARQNDDAPAEPRFRLLDSLREFADEQLADEQREPLQKRWGEYFVNMAASSQDGLRGGEQKEWLSKLDADYPNLRAVLSRAGTAGLQMAAFLRQYWMVHGPLRESAEMVAVLIDSPENTEAKVDEASYAAALNTLGALYLRLGDYASSEPRLAESLRLYQAQNDEAGMARVLSNQGILTVRQGDLASGRDQQKESLLIRLRIGDKWGAAASYLNLGAVLHDMGDLDGAGAAYEESLRISREIGDTRGMGSALLNLANRAALKDDTQQATTLYQECLTIARTQNNLSAVGIALLNLGGLLSNQPETLAQAEAHFSEAFRLYQKAGEMGLAGAALVELARTSVTQKNYPLAQTRLAESLVLPLSRVLVCIALEVGALLALGVGQYEKATVLYGAVEALRASARIPRQTAAHEERYEEYLSTLRAQIGDSAFATAFARGQALTPEQASDLARKPMGENKKTKKRGV